MKDKNRFSELLGILNGINYDEIINEKEIEELKAWIYNNQNNNEIYFQEICITLIRILNKNSLSAEDKKKIMAITEQYYNLNLLIENSEELIGIIQGIKADGIINEKELLGLQNWLNKNWHLQGSYLYDQVTEVVNKIMMDKVIEEVETEYLLVILDELLNNYYIAQKIKLIKMYLKARENIGVKLIELIDDNNLIMKIHQEAQKQLLKLLETKCSIKEVDSDIIFISLVLIALLYYWDGNFYEHVRYIYVKVYDNFSEQKVDGTLRNIINNYITNSNDNRRIISVVLENAIVPKYYLPSFFDFLYDIYKLNFNYSLKGIDTSEELKFAYEGIRKDVNLETNEMNLNVTNKTYKLITATKDLINKNSPALINLSSIILKIIDEYYWEDKDLSIENEYLKYGFDEWKTKYEKEEKEREVKSRDFVSRWEPEFNLVNNNIYLTIPRHKIRNQYDYNKIRIVVTNDKEVILANENVEMYDIIGGYSIKENTVLIENPLGKIRYKLLCGDEIIYDSQEKLYRNYIVFDEKGNEIKHSKSYNGTITICTYEENILNANKIVGCSLNYNLFYINIAIGDNIQIGNDIFFFSERYDSGLIGEMEKVKFLMHKKEIAIYKKVTTLLYVTDNFDSYIVLKINERRIILEKLKYRCKEYENEFHLYITLPDLSNGIYRVAIERKKANIYYEDKIFNFVLDSDFSYLVSEYSNDEIIIDISQSFMAYNFTKIVSFNSEQINVIYFEEKNCGFFLPIEIPLFSVDYRKWHKCDKYIWDGDVSLTSWLITNAIDYECVKAVNKSGKLLTTLFFKEEKGFKKISIGTLKSYSEDDFIYLKFIKNNTVVGFIKYYYKCVVKECTLQYYSHNKKVCLNVNLIGKGNVSLIINDDRENNIFVHRLDDGDNQFWVTGMESFKKYDILVEEEKKGFTLEKKRTLFKDKFSYIKMDDFVGRYFQIFSVDYDIYRDGRLIRKTFKFWNTYIEIIDKIEDNIFVGNIYLYKDHKKYLFNKLNPINVEFTSDIDNGYIEANLTKDGDGLLIDFKNKTMLNDLENRQATDIFSCLIIVEKR